MSLDDILRNLLGEHRRLSTVIRFADPYDNSFVMLYDAGRYPSVL